MADPRPPKANKSLQEAPGYLSERRVKPVPDFSKLHLKWESKLSNSKTYVPRQPESHPPGKAPLGAAAGSRPAGSRPASSGSGTASGQGSKVSMHPPVHASHRTGGTELRTPRPSPPVTTAAFASRTPRHPSTPGLAKTGLHGPARTTARKPLPESRSQTTKFSGPSEEFNNAALADILNSTDSSELDARRNRGGIGRVPLTSSNRLTLNPPRRVTTGPKRETGIGQEPCDEVKRRSMHAGALRVAKKKPIGDPALSPGTTSTFNPGQVEASPMLRAAARTPNRAGPVPFLTPHERHQKHIARTMGLLVAETFGTPQRTPRAAPIELGRTPRTLGVSLRSRMEAERVETGTRLATAPQKQEGPWIGEDPFNSAASSITLDGNSKVAQRSSESSPRQPGQIPPIDSLLFDIPSAAEGAGEQLRQAVVPEVYSSMMSNHVTSPRNGGRSARTEPEETLIGSPVRATRISTRTSSHEEEVFATSLRNLAHVMSSPAPVDKAKQTTLHPITNDVETPNTLNHLSSAESVASSAPTEAPHITPPLCRQRRSSTRRRSSSSSTGSAKIRLELSLLEQKEAALRRRLAEMEERGNGSSEDGSSHYSDGSFEEAADKEVRM
ncbi:hypothetical protein HKX48_007262 [Thoreauomyces humboldtii]|nr:hypothetical protein HKX48_007262 [Thoreauomyces humboldtii]